MGQKQAEKREGEGRGLHLPVEHIGHHLDLSLGRGDFLLRGGLRAAAEHGEGHLEWFVDGRATGVSEESGAVLRRAGGLLERGLDAAAGGGRCDVVVRLGDVEI